MFGARPGSSPEEAPKLEGNVTFYCDRFFSVAPRKLRLFFVFGVCPGFWAGRFTRKVPSFVKQILFSQKTNLGRGNLFRCFVKNASSKLIAVSRVSHCASRVYASVIFYQWILLANKKTAALTSRKFFFGSVSQAVFLGGWNYSRKKHMFSQATHT